MATLELTRGDTNIWDGVAKIDGAEIDLNQYAVWFTAKKNQNDLDSAAVFMKTVGSGITLKTQSGGTLGGFVIELPPSDTLGLVYAFPLWYDVQVKGSDNKVYTADSGTLSVALDVTRATS